MGAHQLELIEAGDTSGNLTSIPVRTRGAVKAAFQSSWTGTTAGTITLQGSNHRLAGSDPSNARVVWTTLTVAAAGIHGTNPPAGVAGSQIQIVTYMPLFVRLVFTRSAGSGLLTVQLDLDDVAD